MFEAKPDPQLEKLTAAVQSLIEVNYALLKKLEQQQTLLGSIAKFVGENHSDRPSFGVSQ